jgi:hypothetical protein
MLDGASEPPERAAEKEIDFVECGRAPSMTRSPSLTFWSEDAFHLAGDGFERRQILFVKFRRGDFARIIR